MCSIHKTKSIDTYSCGKKCKHPYYVSPIEIRLLRAKITYLKSHSIAWVFLSPNRREIDLSFEVLNIDFGQEV